MIRAALVGYGSIAEHGHLPALLSFPQVQIVAVADISPARLARARLQLPDAQLFDSPSQLIESVEPDLLDICSPPNTHAQLIEAACGRSVPTIVSEKPLVLTEHQYERVASARAAAGNRVISVNNWMHSDLNRHVRVLLDEEVIGKVRSIFLRTGRNAAALGHDSWSPRWRTDPAHSGGGIILDHGWHQLYLLLGWMNEPVQEVSAQTRTSNPRNYPVEDEAGIVLKFASGCSSIELTWTSSGRSNDGYITGDRGQIAIHDDRVVVHNGEVERSLPFKGRLTESSYHPDWFREVFRYNVLDENRREADRNFAEAGVLVSTIAAAYRSAQAHGEPRRPKQFESSLSTAEEGLVRGNVMRGGWDSPS